jgi:divalent metal cation (Fe/Co/Zn/Cd) transporter
MRVIFADIHIEVDGNRKLADVELLTKQVEMVIRSNIPYIKKISVIPHSMSSLSVLQEGNTKEAIVSLV